MAEDQEKLPRLTVAVTRSESVIDIRAWARDYVAVLMAERGYVRDDLRRAS